ncbi:MAG: hypothetical protein V4519_00950 [Patescibacteria group bacterium]
MKKIISVIVIITILLLGYINIFYSAPAEDIFEFIQGLLLLLITIFVPAIFIKKYIKRTSKLFATGKGLLVGGLLAILYNLFDFYFIKKIVNGGCGDLCGISNFILGFLSIALILVGIILLIINIVVNIKSGIGKVIDTNSKK